MYSKVNLRVLLLEILGILKWRNLFLLTLITRLFLVHQLIKFWIIKLHRCISYSEICAEITNYISLAHKMTVFASIDWGKSLIKRRNNSGPNTDPWGTPKSTLFLNRWTLNVLHSLNVFLLNNNCRSKVDNTLDRQKGWNIYLLGISFVLENTLYLMRLKLWVVFKLLNSQILRYFVCYSK